MFNSRLFLLATPILTLACATPPEADRLQGVWVSDGYGIGAVVDGGRVNSFAVGDATCLDEGSDPLWGLLKEFNIEVAEDRRSFLLQMKGTKQTIRFDRQVALPSVCARPIPDTPTGNFEVFADMFATHYAFFDIYGVDWGAQTEAARARVHDGMSDTELFAVLSSMIAPLKDGHVGLKGRADGSKLNFEPNPGSPVQEIEQSARARGADAAEAVDDFRKGLWLGNIRDGILAGRGKMVANDFVQYGLAAPDVGYIALATVAGYSKPREGFLEQDKAAINAILDDALAQFARANVRGVIIDLSLNYGGYDEVALTIASRFAEAPTFAYSEYPADADMPMALRQSVIPSKRRTYTGPLYVVTSNMTVSAGEILTMALRALPQTSHIGSPTRGAFSDVLEKELPNGWEVELSNEVYADHQGIVWEGRGITPDRPMDIFETRDPLASHRAAIQAVIARMPKM